MNGSENTSMHLKRGRHSMIKVILVQGENGITLEYDSLEAVEELIKVVGTGSEINDLLVRIRLDMPGEGRME